MAAKIYGDIKPTGLNQRDLINLLYMIISSFRGIANKLDNDGSVTDTDYRDNVDACFNLVIEDCRGNYLNLANTESSTMPPLIKIGEVGFDVARSSDLLYMIFDAWETLCEQLDADTNPPTSTDYEANAYTAMYTWLVENSKGNTLGNGTTFTFRLGAWPQAQLVDLLYKILDGIETFCEQADADAAPADTDYEALWYTANITLTVENSINARLGN